MRATTTSFNPGIGFADPVFGAQAAFRAMLTALSEPGTIQDLGGRSHVPAGIEPATATLLLTLADYETPVFLPLALQEGDAAAWLRFHCGAPLADAAQATFAVLECRAGIALRLSELPVGNELFPDQSATAILQVAALEGGTPLDLDGPGILGTRRIAPAGLPDDFAAQWAENHRRYPMGIDAILVAGNRILGLPRSTRVTPADPQG